MKVTCLQENLAKGLGIVGRAVSTRSTLPVLGNILLAAENGRLKLAATNLEIGITCWIGAQVEEEGAVTVPARTLVDLVNSLPQDRVDMLLTVRTQTLNLRCARTLANLKGIDAQEFPIMPTADTPGVEIVMQAAELREAIAQTVFAAATEDTRPILTGVQSRFQGSQVTLAAADGYRLSVRTAGLAAPVGEPVTLIVPARALSEILRVVTDEDETVTIKLPAGRNQILFHTSQVELVSQLIEGNFPDYQQIIPKSHSTRTLLSVAEFRKACKTSDIFARESAHTARLKITPGSDLTPGHITLVATSAETGDNVAELDANVEGQPVEIAFNVRYLLEALNAIDTGQVALETSGPNNPGRLVPVGRDDFQHVVMPMHIGR
jgi:DNA polymerase-3 subunit beta